MGNDKAVAALRLMVEQFADRPGLFGLLLTSGKRHGWDAATIQDMRDAATSAKATLAEIDGQKKAA
jgi:hypothetical protein